MATYDLEEQEQLENLKAWWRQYGNLVTAILLAVSLSVLGYQTWNWYQRNQMTQASAVFASLQQAANLKDAQRVRAAAGELLEKYPGTRYAVMGALVSASLAFDAGDGKTARAQLSWAVEKADDEMQDLARLRLAAVLLDAAAFDEALTTLKKPARAPFAARFAEMRGDVLLAQGKRADARAAFQQGIDSLQKADDPAATGYREFLSQKRDALGTAK